MSPAALILAAILAAGAGNSSRFDADLPLIDCPPEYDRVDTVIAAWRTGDASETCIRHYVEAYPSSRPEIAQGIASSGRGLDVAFQLLEGMPLDVVGPVYRAITQAAERRGDTPGALRASDELALHSLEGHRETAANLAQAATAAQAFQEGRWAEAASAWREIALGDPAAVQSVERGIAALGNLGPEGEPRIRALCQTLLSHRRAAQAIACLSSAPRDGLLPERWWLEAYAASPAVRFDDVRRLQEQHPSFRDALETIVQCSQPIPPASAVPAGGAWPLAALVTRVADGLTKKRAPQSRCLLHAAARACIAELEESGTCSEPRSIGRYVELLAVAPDELFGFVEGPLREMLRGRGLVGGRRYDGDPQAAAAMFNAHASLAYVLGLPGPSGTKPISVDAVAFHVNRACAFWRESGHGEPFPSEALEGVDRQALSVATASLDEWAIDYIRQGMHTNAEPLYQCALVIKEQVLKAPENKVAEAMDNLAGLYVRRGAYGQAEELYQRALATRERALGQSAPDTVWSRYNLERVQALAHPGASPQLAQPSPLVAAAETLYLRHLPSACKDVVKAGRLLRNADRARLLLIEGLLLLDAADEAGALSSIGRALELDRSARMPSFAPAKAVALLDQVLATLPATSPGSPPRAPESDKPPVSQLIEVADLLYLNLQLEGAEGVLDLASRYRPLSNAEDAQLAVRRGLLAMEQSDEARARRAFAEALRMDPHAQLPDYVPPRTLRLFEGMRPLALPGYTRGGYPVASINPGSRLSASRDGGELLIGGSVALGLGIPVLLVSSLRSPPWLAGQVAGGATSVVGLAAVTIGLIQWTHPQQEIHIGGAASPGGVILLGGGTF